MDKRQLIIGTVFVWSIFFTGVCVHGLFSNDLSLNYFGVAWIYLILIIICLFVVSCSGKHIKLVIR